MTDNYVLVADAADQVKFSREYVRKLAREGRVKSRKVGIVTLIYLPDLLTHVAATKEKGFPRGKSDN